MAYRQRTATKRIERVDDQNYMTLAQPSSTTTDEEESYGGFSRGDDTLVPNPDYAENHASGNQNPNPIALAAGTPIYGAIGGDPSDAYETSVTLNPDYVEHSRLRQQRSEPVIQEDTASPLFSSFNNPRRKGPFRVLSGSMILIFGIAVVALYFAMKSNDDASSSSTNTTAIASASGGLVGQVEALVDIVQTMNDTIQFMNTTIQAQNVFMNSFDNSGGDLSALTVTVTALQEQIHNLQQKNTAMNGTIVAMNGTITVQQNIITSQQVEINVLKQENTAVNSTITNQQVSIYELQQNNTAINISIVELQQKNTDINGTIIDLEQKNTAMNGTIIDLEQKNTALNICIFELERENTAMNGTILTMNSAVQEEKLVNEQQNISIQANQQAIVNLTEIVHCQLSTGLGNSSIFTDSGLVDDFYNLLDVLSTTTLLIDDPDSETLVPSLTGSLLPALDVTRTITKFSLSQQQDITSLNEFNKLVGVGTFLHIGNNNILKSIDGFQKLRRVGGFVNIYYNVMLQSVNGFDELSIVQGYVYIHQNPLISNFNGFRNLEKVGNHITFQLNQGLLTISGFGNLKVAGRIDIAQNDALDSITGFGNLMNVEASLSIHSNNGLQDILGFGNITRIGGNLNIYSNTLLTTQAIDEGFQSLHCIEGEVNCPNCPQWIIELANQGASAPGCQTPPPTASPTPSPVSSYSGFTGYSSLSTKVDELFQKVTALNTTLQEEKRVNQQQNVSFQGYEAAIVNLTAVVDGQLLGNSSGITDGALADVVDALTVNLHQITEELLSLSSAVEYIDYITVPHDTNVPSILGYNYATYVSGYVAMSQTNKITSIGGFVNVVQVGGLSLKSLDELTSVNGFHKLTIIAGDLKIANCNNLINISGLQSVSSILGDINIYNTGLTPNAIGKGLQGLQCVQGGIGTCTNCPQWIIDLANEGASAPGCQTTPTLLPTPRPVSSYSGLTGYSNLLSTVTGLTEKIVLLNTTVQEEKLVNEQQNVSLQEIQEEFVNLTAAVDGQLSANTSMVTDGALVDVVDGLVTDVSYIISAIGYVDYVYILGTSGQNLSGYGYLSVIGGYLEINSNSNLNSIDGFWQLSAIGGYLEIYNNVNLNSIDGFGNVSSIGGYLRIDGNSQLNSIEGLGVVSTIGGSLQINSNPQLSQQAIDDGLKNLKCIKGGIVSNNPGSYCVNCPQWIIDLANEGASAPGCQTHHPTNSPTPSPVSSYSGLSGYSSLVNTVDGLVGKVESLNTTVQEEKIVNQQQNVSIQTNEEAIVNLTEVVDGQLSHSANSTTTLDTASVLVIWELLELSTTSLLPNTICVSLTGETLDPEDIQILHNNFWQHSNGDIDKIDGFNNLAAIAGEFSIQYNGNLKNINGFGSLRTISKSFRIDGENTLSSITGFGSLATIGSYFEIFQCGPLHSITGFHALTAIGGFFKISQSTMNNISGFESLTRIEGSFMIQSNNNLVHINGFDKLSHTLRFQIDNNDVLANIHGFTDLATIAGSFEVRQNSLLEAITGFGALTNIVGKLELSGNDVLVNITGFVSLQMICGTLEIHNNPMLSKEAIIEGLANLKCIKGGIYQNNPSQWCQHCPQWIIDLGNEGASAPGCQTPPTSSPTPSPVSSYSGVSGYTSLVGVMDELVANVSVLQNEVSLNNFYGYFGDTMLNLIISSGIGDTFVLGSGAIDLVTNVTGYLQISNSALVTIPVGGFNTIISIGGYLHIGSNGNLDTINGFGNVSTIGVYLTINNNGNLNSIDGFGQVSTIGGYLHIYSNGNLDTINGFGNVSTIGGYLAINNNGNLNSIDGFGQVSTIGGNLEITSNNRLNSIDGFGQVSTIGGKLEINSNNDLLSINGFGNVSTIGGILYIGSNPQLSQQAIDDGLKNLKCIKGGLGSTCHNCPSRILNLPSSGPDCD